MFGPGTLVLVVDGGASLQVFLRRILKTDEFRLEESSLCPGLWRVYLPNSPAVVYACDPDVATYCLSFVSEGKEQNKQTGNGSRLIGESNAIREVRELLATAAGSESNVLITGETGTGKELAAELIHSRSMRHDKPFICLNCAALPDSLFESEVFGYERGSFTGALHSYEGKLSQAQHGVIFLDEI